MKGDVTEGERPHGSLPPTAGRCSEWSGPAVDNARRPAHDRVQVTRETRGKWGTDKGCRCRQRVGPRPTDLAFSLVMACPVRDRRSGFESLEGYPPATGPPIDRLPYLRGVSCVFGRTRHRDGLATAVEWFLFVGEDGSYRVAVLMRKSSVSMDLARSEITSSTV
jgi:hypothetical protein